MVDIFVRKYITPNNRPSYGELNCPKCLEDDNGSVMKWLRDLGNFHSESQCSVCGHIMIYDQSNYHPNRSPEDQKY